MRIWSKSDVGMVRRENQDSFFAFTDEEKEYSLLIVCDGMGGASGGSVASGIAVKVFCDFVKAHAERNMSVTLMTALIKDAAKLANSAVFEKSTLVKELEGMGTTLVCALVCGDKVVLGNIGDSRAYIADEDGMRQITRDHSLVAEMVKRGEITPLEAMHHPSKNVITRALGVDFAVECDIFAIKIGSGEYIMLCSDGLTNEVSEPEIYYEIYHSQKPENACETLTEIAKTRGGHDNITIVLASF